jgi:hypothetical protein
MAEISAIQETTDVAPDLRDRRVVEGLVREYFSDVPVMGEIARCESRFRHLALDGTVLRGAVTPKDVGVMQINEYYHLAASRKLGLDIHTFEDNLRYARYLFEREGTTPWLSSSKCWGIERHISKK